MNRTNKFFYNSTTTALYQMMVMIAGFITPRVMLKFYGSEINGLVSSINQFIVYFNLVETGLSGAAIYALYKPLADNDHKAINGVVSAAKKFYTQSGYIFVSLTIGFAVIYPMFVRTNAVTPLNVGLLVLVLGVNGALEFFTLSKYRTLLSADQRTYVISLASIVYVIVNTTIIVVLANLRVNIVVLRFVTLPSIFLRSFILMGYVKVKYKYINYKEKPNTAALNKRWDVLYLQILGAIHSGVPVVILTLVTRNLKLVSVYAIFNMVIAGLNGILSIFISGLSASFGDVIARGEEKTLQKAYREFEFFYYSLITVVYYILFVTIMPFIRIYTSGITDINYDLPLIGFLFVINGLLNNIKTPQGMLVISAGMFKETKVQTTTQGAIAVIGGIILVPFFGIAGVLVGSIFSNIYRDIDLLFFIPRNVTKLPVRKTVYRIIRIFMCIAVIWIPFFFIELNPASYASWFATAIGVGIYAVFIVTLIGFIFDCDDMKSIAKRILGMVR
jgi:O-antigen/teichoic acid export membrane protein